MLASDNSFYPPYEVKVSAILDIWEYVCNLGLTNEKVVLAETASVKDLFLKLKADIMI
jgi:hypothetical protein